MHWWYRLIEENEREYIYAYSLECKDLDGIITYDKADKTATLTRASKSDGGSDWAENRSLEHFFTLVREGFPEERHVCCG